LLTIYLYAIGKKKGGRGGGGWEKTGKSTFSFRRSFIVLQRRKKGEGGKKELPRRRSIALTYHFQEKKKRRKEGGGGGGGGGGEMGWNGQRKKKILVLRNTPPTKREEKKDAAILCNLAWCTVKASRILLPLSLLLRSHLFDEGRGKKKKYAMIPRIPLSAEPLPKGEERKEKGGPTGWRSEVIVVRNASLRTGRIKKKRMKKMIEVIFGMRTFKPKFSTYF